MEGREPVLEMRTAGRRQACSRNGTQASAQCEAGMLGSPASKAPQLPGRVGEVGTRTELWVRTAGRRSTPLASVQAPSHSSLQTD